MAMIRAAVPADRDALLEIHCASWRDTYRGTVPDELLGDLLEVSHAETWDDVFANAMPGRVALVAVVENRVSGFLLSYPDRSDPGIDYIDALHIAPGARSGGIGGLLIRHWADRLIGIGRRRAALTVADANTRARSFYRRLGGREGQVFEDHLVANSSAPARRIEWNDISEISIRARGEAIRRLSPPGMLRADTADGWSGAAHPVDAARAAAARRKQPLGDPFGLVDFGINRVEVDPGTVSTVQHHHSHEDEFVFVLEGAFVLRLDDREIALGPGDCAGFPAGEGPSHVLENRSDQTAVYLEVGSRWGDRDVCR
ncbi:MAG: GNAT family N-acetyltransferase, partial [Pseudomonadota bacterium]